MILKRVAGRLVMRRAYMMACALCAAAAVIGFLAADFGHAPVGFSRRYAQGALAEPLADEGPQFEAD